MEFPVSSVGPRGSNESGGSEAKAHMVKACAWILRPPPPGSYPGAGPLNMSTSVVVSHEWDGWGMESKRRVVITILYCVSNVESNI
jgi:hypothetical protein